ncbi:MAG: glycosyltransferase family 39 protein, partial [Myxococcales bacterium]|nr:glycosyltransferase family 39 protein [Myxococcales bacterium]
MRRYLAARFFVLALAVRLAVVAWAGGRFDAAADGRYYHILATRLSQGLGYTWAWPDGVVTYAAHYPVGYPALLAGPYALFGASVEVAMAAHALLGAIGVAAMVVAAERVAGGRLASWVGVVATLHPGLWAYTAALMTEGVTAALWALGLAACLLAVRAARRGPWLVALGVILGLATLVRPQSLLLAPIVGWLAWPRRGWLGAAGAVALTLAVCAPWTVRNCERMGRCALVSVNSGWNLLIGTDDRGRGGWAPLEVPPSCREVFDEAEKDRCFAAAARARIAERPLDWLALAPRKLGVTFDYCGAAGWYLHEANPAAFPERDKAILGVVETTVERLLLLAALLGVFLPRRRRLGGRLVGLVAVASALSP